MLRCLLKNEFQKIKYFQCNGYIYRYMGLLESRYIFLVSLTDATQLRMKLKQDYLQIYLQVFEMMVTWILGCDNGLVVIQPPTWTRKYIHKVHNTYIFLSSVYNILLTLTWFNPITHGEGIISYHDYNSQMVPAHEMKRTDF